MGTPARRVWQGNLRCHLLRVSALGVEGARDLFTTIGPTHRNGQHVAVYGAKVAQDMALDLQHSSSSQLLKWDFPEPKVG